LLILTHSILFI